MTNKVGFVCICSNVEKPHFASCPAFDPKNPNKPIMEQRPQETIYRAWTNSLHGVQYTLGYFGTEEQARAILPATSGSGPGVGVEPIVIYKPLGHLKAADVEWVVNDLAELGVKIGSQFFFLYKSNSLESSGSKWRPVYKREFGECCTPWNAIEEKQYGDVAHPRPVRKPDSYVGFLGEDQKEWKDIPQKEEDGD